MGLKSMTNSSATSGHFGAHAEAAEKQSKYIREGYQAYNETRLNSSFWPQKNKLLSDVYTSLNEEFFQSPNPRDKLMGALTAKVLKNQVEHIEHKLRTLGESTVLTSLGSLAPRVLDVVRVFFPNQIATLVADIQALDGPSGNILTLKPIYTTDGPGVKAGQEIFTTQHDGDYASDIMNIALQSGADGTKSNTFAIGPVRPGTVKILRDGENIGGDDGQGNFTGGVTGNLTYGKGGTFSISPAGGGNFGAEEVYVVEYRWDLEQDREGIREVEIGIQLVPVRAKSHPITTTRSVEAELADQATYNIDIQDKIAKIAIEEIRKDRDRALLRRIRAAAEPVPALDFNAASSNTNPGITRTQHWQDFDLKVQYAKSYVFRKNGRGSVSFVVCGINANNVISSITGKFQSEQNTDPISSYKSGTYEGNIDVIVDAHFAPDEYVFGYRGMQSGDASIILAEWVPIYVTPEFQTPTFDKKQGFASFYDILVNNPGYFVRGTLENFSA